MTCQLNSPIAMPAQDNSLKLGQAKSSHANLADVISSTAEKDRRMKPWQGAHNDVQATSHEGKQDHGAKMDGKDEYWMTEGSVNASS